MRASSPTPRSRNSVAALWCGTTQPTEFPKATTGTQYVKRNADRRKDAAEKIAATIPAEAVFNERSAILQGVRRDRTYLQRFWGSGGEVRKVLWPGPILRRTEPVVRNRNRRGGHREAGVFIGEERATPDTPWELHALSARAAPLSAERNFERQLTSKGWFAGRAGAPAVVISAAPTVEGAGPARNRTSEPISGRRRTPQRRI